MGDNNIASVGGVANGGNQQLQGLKNDNHAATGKNELPKILVDGNFELARIRKNPSQDDINSPIIVRVKKGTVLEKLGESKDGKWIKVRVNGKDGWVAARLTKNIEQPAPEVVKAPEPEEEYTPPMPVETEDPEAVLDRNLRNLFKMYGLSRSDKDDLKSKLATLKNYLMHNNGRITYKHIDEMTTIKKGFKGIDLLAPDLHCLRQEYRNRGNEYFVVEIKKDEKRELTDKDKMLSERFQRSFVKPADASEMSNAEEISREEAKKLGISDRLFDLIDQKMNIYDKGNGKITLYEMSLFNSTIKKYCLAFNVTEEKAKDIYKKAENFEMADLDKVIDTATLLQSSGIIKERTSYGDLKKITDPRLHGAIRHEFAVLRGIKDEQVTDDKWVYWQGTGNTRVEADVNRNITNMCRLLAAFPIISKLDPKDQEELFGIAALPKFDGILNEDNILKYSFNDSVAVLIAGKRKGNAAATAVAFSKAEWKTWEDIQKLAEKMQIQDGESRDALSARVIKRFISENPGITEADILKIQGKKIAVYNISKALADNPDLLTISAADIKMEPTTVEEWAKKDVVKQLLVGQYGIAGADGKARYIPGQFVKVYIGKTPLCVMSQDTDTGKVSFKIGGTTYDTETQLGEAFNAILRAFEEKGMGRKGAGITGVYDNQVKLALDNSTSGKNVAAAGLNSQEKAVKVENKDNVAAKKAKAAALAAEFNSSSDKARKIEILDSLYNSAKGALIYVEDNKQLALNSASGDPLSFEILRRNKRNNKTMLGLD